MLIDHQVQDSGAERRVEGARRRRHHDAAEARAGPRNVAAHQGRNAGDDDGNGQVCQSEGFLESILVPKMFE